MAPDSNRVRSRRRIGTYPAQKLSDVPVPRPKKKAKPKKIQPEEIVESPLPDGTILIEKLTNFTCRWPMWEDGSPIRNYCGKPTAPAWSYCEKHKLLAMR